MLARRGKRPKNHYFFAFLVFFHTDTTYIKWEWNSKNFFYILVHPNAHACFPNTKINTMRKYTNTKYIGLEIIPKCYQILGPISKNIMHILTGCPWNHFGCQSLKERFFRDTLYVITIKKFLRLFWITTIPCCCCCYLSVLVVVLAFLVVVVFSFLLLLLLHYLRKLNLPLKVLLNYNETLQKKFLLFTTGSDRFCQSLQFFCNKIGILQH